MDLLELRDRRAFPSIHALMIHPFKEIWEADESVEKTEAIKIFSYVELVCSPKKSNPYFGYSETDRPPKVKKEIWGDNPPEDPTIIIEAVIKYKELLENDSITYSLFISSINASEELKDYLSSIDLNERTGGGSAVIKPKDVTAALKEIPDVMKSLETMRNKVNGELLEEAKTRNSREIGLYEE